MDNKVINKQISIKKIIDVANYLEDYKERYDKIFQQEKIKNKDLKYSEKNFEYENGNAEVRYTIELHNGKRMNESDYNWFIENLNEPKIIKEIDIYLLVTYMGKTDKDDFNSKFNKISASVNFRDRGMNLKHSDVIVNVETTNQEREVDNLYSTIMNMLEDSEDRYNKTIKNRKIRIQCFTISIGIILSYILYAILKINIDTIPQILAQFMRNKYILVFGQWFVAILMGNVFSYWYIFAIYKPLLPEAKYAGYNSSTYKSVYKDDVDDYLEHSEVQFGKFWDAEKEEIKLKRYIKLLAK